MHDIALKIENLSKCYRLGEREPYKTFREFLVRFLKAPFQPPQNSEPSRSSDTVWALQNVSFEVQQGEVIGIIGRNGAGKSTLLKILAKITEPTSGRVELHGRIGSLLEVGTGFHPELTGRENIFLYGAILGMSRAEIIHKFDEIVAFAELEKFIHTPVKRYSSGMYMRLAFAVAAHLETEILLIDEVLAVGDAAFQKKCLGKMGDVAIGGRTILFVSHQMNAIRKLCSHCVWLNKGQIQLIGSPEKVISAYEAAIATIAIDSSNRKQLTTAAAQFLSWELIDPKADKKNILTTIGPVILKTVVQTNKPIRNGHHGIALWNNDGQLIWAWAANKVTMPVGTNEFIYTLPSLPLRPGVYYWQVSLYEDDSLLDNWYCSPEFIIATQPQGHHLDQWNGLLNLSCDFKIEHLE